MTITERAAYTWLLAHEGYTPDTLRFQRRASPDFLGEDGRAWEVKLVRNRVVVFAASQLTALREHDACSVVLWGRGDAPEAVVSLDELEIPGRWHQYRLHLSGAGERLLTVRLPEDLHEVARAAAAAARLTPQAFLADILREQLERVARGSPRPAHR